MCVVVCCITVYNIMLVRRAVAARVVARNRSDGDQEFVVGDSNTLEQCCWCNLSCVCVCVCEKRTKSSVCVSVCVKTPEPWSGSRPVYSICSCSCYSCPPCPLLQLLLLLLLAGCGGMDNRMRSQHSRQRGGGGSPRLLGVMDKVERRRAADVRGGAAMEVHVLPFGVALVPDARLLRLVRVRIASSARRKGEWGREMTDVRWMLDRASGAHDFHGIFVIFHNQDGRGHVMFRIQIHHPEQQSEDSMRDADSERYP